MNCLSESNISLLGLLSPLLHVLTSILPRLLDISEHALFYFTYLSTVFFVEHTFWWLYNTNFHSLLPSCNLSALTCLTPGFSFDLTPADLCPDLFPLCFLSVRCSCWGSRGNGTLWGTCGWWVAPGLWAPGTACVTTTGGCWDVHDDSHTPCLVSFVCRHRPLPFYQRGVQPGEQRRKSSLSFLP